MKSLSDLPKPSLHISVGDKLCPLHISIPQPVGPNAPIITHNVTTASKMLGVHFSPAGSLLTHVEHMVQKGLNWVDCLLSKPPPRRDAWLSFYMQLFPGISWGLVTICLSPRKLDSMFQKVYAPALPFLGVSSKIKKEWCMLPESFQGLSLPFFPLVALSEKLSFLLGNWGFHGLAHSDALAMAFDNFLMEVGLYGSPLCWSYADYGSLSMDASWFRNLWKLVDYFNVDLLLQEADLVHGVREGDWSLMSEFFCLGYCGKQLVALNIVWHFCNLLHVSDIVKCNGVTLDEFVVSNSTEVSVSHVFSCKEPTAADFRLWE
jgi:hypothetical protein